MDLLDWYRDRLTSRRLAVLVKHLPRDSATLRELHGEASQWSVTDYLLANIVDQLAEANWMFATVNRDEDAEPLEYPRPVPRPATESTPEGMSEGTSVGAASPSVNAVGTRDGSPPSEAGSAPRNPSAFELAQFFS